MAGIPAPPPRSRIIDTPYGPVDIHSERDFEKLRDIVYAKIGNMRAKEEWDLRVEHKMTATEVLARQEEFARRAAAQAAMQQSSVLQELRAKKAQCEHRHIAATVCYLGQETYKRMMREVGGPASFLHQELHLNQTLLGMRIIVVTDEEHIGVGL